MTGDIIHNNTQKAEFIYDTLNKKYPSAECALEAEGDPFRLMVMAVLSAQCTDKRVNEVSKTLFAVLPDAQAFASSKPGELEALIRSVGLHNAKAKNLRAASKMLVDEYGGVLPHEMDDLLRLPGVGRKVANLLRGDIFGLGGIVADTHCIRICNRLGFTPNPDPVTTEKVMQELVPLERQSRFCHCLVLFGRETCAARKPLCHDCELSGVCEYIHKTT